ncbi:hypothetical protein FSARC_7982 [Fusarium sarcochroum]|uniref:Uncharacterized protein n=1 Tax=Fusarium sarcochroum TaxID=1208366 RepID=A0A8H4TU13_9HYPO|nr:hypothetical protein FSARC_7982 [Fusarium sarcochroum]
MATLSIRQVGDGTTGSRTFVPAQYILNNGIPTSPKVVIFNETLAKPFPFSPTPREADAFYKLEMQPFGSSLHWALDDILLLPEHYEHIERPILFDKHSIRPLGNHSIYTKTGHLVTALTNI